MEIILYTYYILVFHIIQVFLCKTMLKNLKLNKSYPQPVDNFVENFYLIVENYL
nr:MAG TPA: hypothetical protein [Caudoviricetes sp.]